MKLSLLSNSVIFYDPEELLEFCGCDLYVRL